MTHSHPHSSYLIRLAVALFAALIALLSARVAAAQPATTAPSAACRVLVLPFTTDNVPESYRWLGRGIQQSLVADLAQSPRVEPLSARDAAPADTTEAAIDAARKADATYVVFGTCQVADPDVRITGQVIDVTSGQRVTSLKATGAVRDAFHIEDALASQVQQALGVSPTRGDVGGGYAGSRSYDNAMDDANFRRFVPDSYSLPYYEGSAYTPSYDYAPAYPYYGYGYPLYGYSFYTYPFAFRGHGFYHGRFDHGAFHGGTFNHGGFPHGGSGFHGGFHGGMTGHVGGGRR